MLIEKFVAKAREQKVSENTLSKVNDIINNVNAKLEAVDSTYRVKCTVNDFELIIKFKDNGETERKVGIRAWHDDDIYQPAHYSLENDGVFNAAELIDYIEDVIVSYLPTKDVERVARINGISDRFSFDREEQIAIASAQLLTADAA